MSKLIALPMLALAWVAVASAPGLPPRDRDHYGTRNFREDQVEIGARGSANRRCAKRATNVRDGRDPWGRCFPGPSNTGVPNRIVLRPYAGPCRITRDRTRIRRRNVNCDLNINAANVLIRNSRVNGNVDVTGSGSLSISDSTIDAGLIHQPDVIGHRALTGNDFRAIRVELTGGYSGGECDTANCVLRNSWVHGQDPDEGGIQHYSGFRIHANGKYVHNTFACDAPTIPPDAGCSADVTAYAVGAEVHDNLMERNLFVESNGKGGYCTYGGSNFDHPKSYDNIWRKNVYQRGANGKCGEYGPMTDFEAGVRGNVWKNNRWDNGRLMRPEG